MDKKTSIIETSNLNVISDTELNKRVFRKIREREKRMKKNILKKFAITIASTTLALTAPVLPNAPIIGTATTVEAATVKTPSTVKLNKISSPAYNKVTISWKKASNATNYYIYYRESGTKKWTKIASVKSNVASYTYTASYKYPITVGKKFDYTVKAYNSKSRKFGKYNTKGLTIKTVPNAVTNMDATILSDNTVQLTWVRSFCADKYIIYRKTSVNADWQKLDTINGTYYVDKIPIVNQASYYMVKPYIAKYRVYGKFDADGIEVYVKTATTPDTPTPTPTKKPEQPTVTPSPTPQPTQTPITPSPTPKPTETPKPTPKPEPNAEQMAQEIIRLTNIERAKVGNPPLQYHAKLQQAAMVRAKEISIKFSHVRPDGRNSDTALAEAGVGCPDLENIAKGYGTPERVVQAWMNSPGHRAAMLSSTATHIGVGFYKAANGGYYWVQEFSSDPDKKCTLTCNANGGTFEDGQEVKTFTFPCDMEIDFSKYIPIPTKDGYTFVDWDGIPGIVLNVSTKVTATWTPNN